MLLICYMLAFIYKSKYTSLYLDHACVVAEKMNHVDLVDGINMNELPN